MSSQQDGVGVQFDPSPVRASGHGGRGAVLALVGLTVLGVAFLVGYRLGGGAVPRPTALAAPTMVANPEPSFIVPPDFVVPGSVSSALRAVFLSRPWMTPCPANNGGPCPSTGLSGRVAICDVGRVIDCRPVQVMDVSAVLGAIDRDGSSAFAGLETTRVAQHHLVVAADLSSPSASARLLSVLASDEAARLQVPFIGGEVLLPAVNPDGQGVWYADLGVPNPGDYVLLIQYLDETDIPPGGTQQQPAGPSFAVTTIAVPLEIT